MEVKAPSEETLEEAISRLAQLSPVEYDMARHSVAEKHGIRTSTLDKEVNRQRPVIEDEPSGQGQSISFPDVEPWPAPVDGDDLIREIANAFLRYVVMDSAALVAVSIWTVFTHGYHLFDHSPRLALQSPEPRCGKTTVVKIVEKLVPRALRADNITAAALFRTIEFYRPTLLVDEVDAFARENEELRGIINSGHDRLGGKIIRNVGDDHEPRAFNTWGPMLLAGIGRLPQTIEDRSLILKLRRKNSKEVVERFRSNGCSHLDTTASKIVRWVQDHQHALSSADPAIPPALGDRAADNWRPLLAIADEAGAKWPNWARQAAVRISADRQAATESAGTRLLRDMKSIFTNWKKPDMSSTELVHELYRVPEGPWTEWSRGKPISPKRVAEILGSYGIHPRKLKTGNRPNGYELAQFKDTFDRYLA